MMIGIKAMWIGKTFCELMASKRIAKMMNPLSFLTDVASADPLERVIKACAKASGRPVFDKATANAPSRRN